MFKELHSAEREHYHKTLTNNSGLGDGSSRFVPLVGKRTIIQCITKGQKVQTFTVDKMATTTETITNNFADQLNLDSPIKRPPSSSFGNPSFDRELFTLRLRHRGGISGI